MFFFKYQFIIIGLHQLHNREWASLDYLNTKWRLTVDRLRSVLTTIARSTCTWLGMRILEITTYKIKKQNGTTDKYNNEIQFNFFCVNCNKQQSGESHLQGQPRPKPHLCASSPWKWPEDWCVKEVRMTYRKLYTIQTLWLWCVYERRGWWRRSPVPLFRLSWFLKRKNTKCYDRIAYRGPFGSITRYLAKTKAYRYLTVGSPLTVQHLLQNTMTRPESRRSGFFYSAQIKSPFLNVCVCLFTRTIAPSTRLIFSFFTHRGDVINHFYAASLV